MPSKKKGSAKAGLGSPPCSPRRSAGCRPRRSRPSRPDRDPTGRCSSSSIPPARSAATTPRSSARRDSTRSRSRDLGALTRRPSRPTGRRAGPTASTTPRSAALAPGCGGGNLIAMRPTQLAGLLGLGADTGDLAGATCRSRPARGITGETMQFHGTADRWTVAGATTVATLYSGPTPAHGEPGGDAALRRRRPGRRVHLRPRPLGRLHAPGQPGVGGQERDGELDGLIRSDDLFFGGRRSPTGSTSTRSRSRRPTSSSACSPT